MRSLKLISSSALMVALCTLLACGGQPQTEGEPTPNDPQSGGLEGAPTDAPAGQEDENPGNALGIGKITICHIPPGNPANAHTITVGLPALKAHTKHGDTLGACGTGGDVDAGTGGGDVDAGTGGGDVDAGPAPDAGSGGGDVDAGAPECAPVGATCGSGVACCDGLTCGPEGYCEPIIG